MIKYKYIIAIRGKGIYEFKTKHERAMFLDEVSKKSKKKIDYAFSEKK